jgi:hypothetical protein
VGTIDPGAALRDWFNARDVRRWLKRESLPMTLDRTYWTAYEYQQDLGRLQRCRYIVTSERVTRPFDDMSPNVTIIGPRMVRARRAKQVVLYRVSYALPQAFE